MCVCVDFVFFLLALAQFGCEQTIFMRRIQSTHTFNLIVQVKRKIEERKKKKIFFLCFKKTVSVHQRSTDDFPTASNVLETKFLLETRVNFCSFCCSCRAKYLYAYCARWYCCWNEFYFFLSSISSSCFCFCDLLTMLCIVCWIISSVIFFNFIHFFLAF